MFKKITLILFGIIGLVLTFGSEGAYDSSLSLKNEDRPKVTLSHMSWDDSLASTAVIKNVLEDEGFQVNLVQLDPTFIFSSLATGDSDFSVSPWLPITHESYMEEYGEDLDIIGSHTDGAQMALVAPAYMEIESIDELTNEADQTITGIEPGAGITLQIDDILAHYDNLSDWNHQQSSTGAMLTELGQAYNNQEEIVVAGWTPHWMFIDYDLVMLEDPEEIFGLEESITTVAREGFDEDNPTAYQIISNFSWDLEDIQEVMLDLQDISPDAAARKWIDNNPDKVAEWTEGISE